LCVLVVVSVVAEHHNNEEDQHLSIPLEKMFVGDAIELYEIEKLKIPYVGSRVFSFCLNLDPVPVSDRYHAVVTFQFDEEVDRFTAVFGMSTFIEFTTKEKQKELTFPLHSPDGVNQWGWRDSSFNQPLSGTVFITGASLVSVTLKAKASWVPAPENVETCPSKFHTQVITLVGESTIELIGLPLLLTLSIMSAFLFITLSICACCCVGGTSTYDEEKYVRNFSVQDEEEIIQMVQQQSLDEYNTRLSTTRTATYDMPQGYMRIPLVSPELHNQYLISAQQQNDHM